MSTKERLIHYLKPMRKSLIFAFVFALLFVASQLAQPFLLGRSLDASKDNAENIFNIYLDFCKKNNVQLLQTIKKREVKNA